MRRMRTPQTGIIVFYRNEMLFDLFCCFDDECHNLNSMRDVIMLIKSEKYIPTYKILQNILFGLKFSIKKSKIITNSFPN